MIKDLLAFLDASPVNFLAVKTLKERLAAAGFKEMDSTAPIGTIEPGDQLFFTKNDSSLYAVRIGRQTIADAGFHLICAHCDSPTFRIKPNPEMVCEGGITNLNSEV